MSLRATRSNLGEKELHDDVTPYDAEESDLSQYFVKEGELGPYASLLYFIEIEIQIERETNFLKRLLFYSSQMIVQQGEPGPDWDYDVKPIYVISFARFRVFDDDRPLHRAGFLDYETANPLIDSANFTIVELSKVKKMIRKSDSEAAKWMFIFRYLHRLKELPPALKTEKFEGLLPFAKLARFNKKELKRYRYIMHLKWDRYAQELAFAEDHPDFVKKIEEKVIDKVERMLKKGASMDKIRTSLGLSNNSK